MIFAASVCALGFLLWLTGCSRPGRLAEDAVDAAPPAPSPSSESSEDGAPIALVVTQEVQPETWHETVELSAELVPWAAVTVAAEVAGRVVDLPVDHGDRVAAGDVIARLDAAVTEAELAQVRARLASTRVALAQAERDLGRGRSLSSDILSADAVDQLALAVDMGHARVAEAEAAVGMVAERLEDLVVCAPFAGVISHRQVELGSWLAPGTPVMRIVSSQRLKARASASPRERVRLRPGLPVTLRTDSVAEVAVGEVRFLGEEAEARTGTYLVEAEITGGAALLPGMSGVMHVELARHQDLLLAESAIVRGVDEQHVFVVEDSVARQRLVSVAAAVGGRLRILSGLEPGERVVVKGQHRLRDGQPVEERVEEREQRP